MIVCLNVAWLLRVARPIGADRWRARWRQRVGNGLLIALFGAVAILSNHFGGSGAGELLGVVAGAAGAFAVLSIVTVTGDKSRPPRRG